MQNVQAQNKNYNLLDSDIFDALQSRWADNPVHIYVECDESLKEDGRIIVISRDEGEYITTYIDEYLTYDNAIFLTSAIEMIKNIQRISFVESISYLSSICMCLVEKYLYGTTIPHYKFDKRRKSRIFRIYKTRLSRIEIKSRQFPRATLLINDLVDVWNIFGGYIAQGIPPLKGTSGGRWWYGRMSPIWLPLDKIPTCEQHLEYLYNNGITSMPAPTDIVMPSDDFRTLRVRGREYSFTLMQAEAIKCLFQAHQQGISELHQERIMGAAEAQSTRLRDLFRSSPDAWKHLIVKGSRRGFFRLNIFD